MKNFTSLASCLLASLIASSAFAHAEDPSARRIFDLPQGEWLLMANFGVTGSAVAPRFVCEEAFLGGDGWAMAPLSSREWVTFGETSIKRTTDGCSFEQVASLSRAPTDTAFHRESGRVAYISNSADEAGVFVSLDRGASFERVAFDTETHQLSGIRFVDEDTLLVSAYSRADMGAAKLVALTISSGQARELSIDAQLRYPALFDVRGDSIAWLARRDQQQIVFWGSVDAPQMVEHPVGNWPSGAVLAADGQTLWISGTHEGAGITIGRRIDGEASFEDVATDQPASCIGRVEDVIYVCSVRRRTGFDLMKLEQGELRGVLSFYDLKGPRKDCPQSSQVATVCPVVWREIASYFGVDPDAEKPDAGPDVGASASDVGPVDTGLDGAASAQGGCCATSPAGGGALPLAALLIVAALGRGRARVMRAR